MLTGRPCKLTPAIQSKIVEYIHAGAYIETAAAAAGISKDTLYAWLRRGARGDGTRFREFSDAVERALAQAELRDLLIIGKAAQTQWQAAAWRLERKCPDRWGRKVRIEPVERQDPQEFAQSVREALAQMRATVPPPLGVPALPT